jgi:predicted alpha/beta hydrolase family esterase
MKAILIHGTCDKDEYFNDDYPSLSNSHWFPWLQKQLLIRGISTQTPEIPDAYQPVYEKWKEEFEKQQVDENTVVVGHSCGGGFLLRYFSENNVKISKFIMVAPWLDPERVKTDAFFEFTIDKDLVQKVREIHLFVSSDDMKDILVSVEKIKNKLPDLILHEFADRGHFTKGDMGSEQFPELLSVVTS